MKDPRLVSPQSIMPAYPWLLTNDLDLSSIDKKIRVMQKLGVPYPEGFVDIAKDDLLKQADLIVENLRNGGVETQNNKEIVALIAYLHRLGADISKK